MPKPSQKEITNKIVVLSKNRFVLKALCDELLRYEFKHYPLILSENEATIKIDLDNKVISLCEDALISKGDIHFEIPKNYLNLIKKIDDLCKNVIK